MAYNTEHLTKLSQLKALAEKVKADYAKKVDLEALEGRVDNLDSSAITAIKVNGTAQTPAADKSVNIAVPTKVSQISNDSGFQTSAQVSTAIQTAIAAKGHASFKKVATVPTAASAEENVLYLVMNTQTSYYDIYAKVENEVVRLDDTSVDLSGYVTKETGKGLSTNDYTTAEKTKLAGLSNYTHPSHTAKTSGLYKITVDSLGHISAATAAAKADITALGIPAQDTTYSVATASANGLMAKADKSKLDSMSMATDAEVTEMLNEVFSA